MEYSTILTCGHCGNISKMEIIGSVGDIKKGELDPKWGYGPDEGTFYQVLKCPACFKINIFNNYWHESMDSDDDTTYELLYPKTTELPIGLPEKILTAYKAAEKVKIIDVNAYAILMRRLLEMVCMDRNAKGTVLALMLKDLADKGEIPEKLVKVAVGLKDFGNLGAHAAKGELSVKEIPILYLLSKAILEYIYSAPYLASLAEDKLNEIKKPKKK